MYYSSTRFRRRKSRKLWWATRYLGWIWKVGYIWLFADVLFIMADAKLTVCKSGNCLCRRNILFHVSGNIFITHTHTQTDTRNNRLIFLRAMLPLIRLCSKGLYECLNGNKFVGKFETITESVQNTFIPLFLMYSFLMVL